MSAKTIDHATLARLLEAGSVRAHVVGRPGGWAVLVQYGTTERPLVAQRSRQVRIFRRMETLVSYLRGMGIQRFEVDAAEYAQGGGKSNRRPDRAEALRRAHEAAAHDAWFREQVEVALMEADDPSAEWISQERVKEDMERQRAELLARIKGDAE